MPVSDNDDIIPSHHKKNFQYGSDDDEDEKTMMSHNAPMNTKSDTTATDTDSFDDEFERSLAATGSGLNKKRSVYISEQGKKNLAKYKYSGSDHSLISPFLQPFWNWVVNYLPETMAYVILPYLFITVEMSSMFARFLSSFFSRNPHAPPLTLQSFFTLTDKNDMMMTI